MKLLLASRNQGKLAEIREMLAGSNWQVLDLTQAGLGLHTVEDGTTFADNARRKARAAADAAGLVALADDSGLEVDALNGEPGVHSARYCGEQATDQDRYQEILRRMVSVPEEQRTARFCCVICVAEPEGVEHFFEGVCGGRIAFRAAGTGGFGYDPVFIPDGYTHTFAELGAQIKNRISHRAKAMTQAVQHLMSRPPATGR